MWLASCAHVARLLPPRALSAQLSQDATPAPPLGRGAGTGRTAPPRPPCPAHYLGVGRFASEFWVLSHPAAVASDVLPVSDTRGRPINYAWAYGSLPQVDSWEPSLARFPRPGLRPQLLLLNKGYAARAHCSGPSYRARQYTAAYGAAAAGRLPAAALHCGWLRLVAGADWSAAVAAAAKRHNPVATTFPTGPAGARTPPAGLNAVSAHSAVSAAAAGGRPPLEMFLEEARGQTLSGWCE